MTVKQAILKVSRKWRVKDDLGVAVKKIKPALYETIGRDLRLLVAEGLMEKRPAKNMNCNEYRKV